MVTWNSAAVVLGALLDSLTGRGLAGTELPARHRLRRRQRLGRRHGQAPGGIWLAERESTGPGCVVQTGRNAGYSAAINLALKHSDSLPGGPFSAVLILNPDIRLEPGCAARLVAPLQPIGLPAQPVSPNPPEPSDRSGSPVPELLGENAQVANVRVGISVPRMLDESGRLSHSLRREPTVLRALGEAVLGGRAGRYPRFGEVVLAEADYRAPTVADWATGAIMMISAGCLTACGTWDESFFLYSEETEFALRARDRGFTTRLVPEAVAVHLGGESGVSARLWTLLTINRVRLYRRRHHLPAAIAYWGVTLLREFPRAALGNGSRSRSAVAALLRPSRLRRPDLGMH